MMSLRLPTFWSVRLLMCFGAALSSLGCTNGVQLAVEFTESEWMRAQAASYPTVLRDDPTNRFANHKEVAAFGETLFFDERLSPDGVTCASCHPPDANWGAGAVDFGAFVRQVPSLLNVGHQRWFTWDGRKDTLWSQIVGPLEHEREMASDRLHVAHAIYRNDDLRIQFETLFFHLPALDETSRFPAHARPSDDPDDPLQQAWASMAEADRERVNDVLVAVGKSIAAFERTLLTDRSPFDLFVQQVTAGEPDGTQFLTPSAQRGAKLFFGAANCHLCHSGPLFSDFEFHNLGLPSSNAPIPDLGRLAGVDRLLRDPFNGLSRHNDATDSVDGDKIRFLRASSAQEGQFKTPSLRNVERSPPYMHTGEFATLTEVVEFYARLPGNAAVGHREETLQALELGAGEIEDLVAFLRSLSADLLLAAP